MTNPYLEDDQPQSDPDQVRRAAASPCHHGEHDPGGGQRVGAKAVQNVEADETRHTRDERLAVTSGEVAAGQPGVVPRDQPAEPHLLTPLAHLGYYSRVDQAPYDPIITQGAMRELVKSLPQGNARIDDGEVWIQVLIPEDRSHQEAAFRRSRAKTPSSPAPTSARS